MPAPVVVPVWTVAPVGAARWFVPVRDGRPRIALR